MNFDVGMGAYHGAQACEIVGLFLLSLLKDLPNFVASLYRDDGLGVTSSTPRQQEKLRQRIVKIFAEQGLKITISVNQKRVDYLDVSMDLEIGLYGPYRKPGDRPLYVSAQSNHPPQIIRNLPAGIERRLSDNSSTEEIFNNVAPLYQAELDRCGYDYQLKFHPRGEVKAKKSRKRRVTWFNPPYSMNIATNVGRDFLKLIDKHFPPGHILHSTISRQTVKVSYRCLPNMGAHIARHNAKLLRGASKKDKNETPPHCNCLKSRKKYCPLPGACKQQGVIYQAEISNSNGDSETYVGLAKDFKKRYYTHMRSINKPSADNSTTFSTYYLQEENMMREPKIKWKILERNIPDYNPVTRKCQLCIREKFTILFKPELCSLNSKDELFGHCRHKCLKLIEAHPD